MTQLGKKSAKDINGREVTVGSKVRLLTLPERFLSSHPTDAKLMIGKVFEICEVDDYG